MCTASLIVVCLFQLHHLSGSRHVKAGRLSSQS